MADGSDYLLNEDERKRIREEVRYVHAILKEGRPPEKEQSILQKILSYLSNGFVLLIIGSLITSVLVPHFQHEFEKKKQRTILMQECLSQYLLYSNSIWQEYYAIFPLTHNNEIDKETYNKYITEISQIKLRRYDAFAKVQGLASVFRTNKISSSEVEQALHNYAIRVNGISEAIDTWLRHLYCAPDKCVTDNRAPIDPNFRAYESFLKLQPLVYGIQDDEKKISELMVNQIKLAE